VLPLFSADIRHLQELWNMAQPDSFRQNEMNQVQRYSTTNQGPAVVVGETVNSDPAAWINNGSGPNNLSKQVLSHTSA
jgi:hypothetical protein